jgi:iron complex transport system ATP-binding protein
MYLTVEQITCRYGSRTVLSDFSLQVERGEFLAVVGPNGSGKSTLVRAISRVIRPAAGRILLSGRDIASLSARALAREVAVLSQETAISFDFTVEEVVRMGRLPHLSRFRGETEADRRAVEEAMALTRTAEMAGRLVTRLSGGERQRVLFARALAQQPSLLILDEPTAHLDIAYQVELLDLTWRLNRERGLTVIAVLHDLNLAALYASRILMMREGRPVAHGAPPEVLTEENVAAVYGSRVRVVEVPEEGRPHVMLLSAVRTQG